MQIFAYTECPDFNSLLEVECKDITGLKPAIHHSMDELINIIEILPKIDVLILDFPVDDLKKAQAESFLAYCSKKFEKIFLLSDDPSIPSFRVYSKMEIPILFDDLKQFYSKDEVPQEGWVSIPLSTLIHFSSLPFDLYIKISDSKYVKRIHAFEEIDREILDGFYRKGLEELHCEKKFKRDFSMMLIHNMINKVDRQYPSFQKQFEAHNEVFETTKEIIQNLGISGRVIEVCHSTIDRMCQDVIYSSDDLRSYLLSFKNDKSLTFNFKLISLTNYIGTQLILEMKLPQVEEEIRKFVYASFFCDMALKNPILHFVRKLTDKNELDQNDLDEVNSHALNACKLVEKSKCAPKDVSLIIMQHHGSFTGLGFPSGKSNQLLPLSKVMIISQDLAFSILTNEDTPVLETLRKFLKTHVNSGLADFVKLLEESLIKNQEIR